MVPVDVRVEAAGACPQVELLDLTHLGQIVEGLVDGLQGDGRHTDAGLGKDGLGARMTLGLGQHLEDALPLGGYLEPPLAEQPLHLHRRPHNNKD